MRKRTSTKDQDIINKDKIDDGMLGVYKYSGIYGMFSPQASGGLQAHPYVASRGALGPAFYGRHPRTTTSACIGARCNIAARHITDGVTAEVFKTNYLKGSGEPSDPVNRPAVHY